MIVTRKIVVTDKAFRCLLVLFFLAISSSSFALSLSTEDLNKYLGDWSVTATSLASLYCNEPSKSLSNIDTQKILASLDKNKKGTYRIVGSNETSDGKLFSIESEVGENLNIEFRQYEKLVDGDNPFFENKYTLTITKYTGNGNNRKTDQEIYLELDDADCKPTRAAFLQRSARGQLAQNFVIEENNQPTDLNHPDPSKFESIYEKDCHFTSSQLETIQKLALDTQRILIAVVGTGVDYNHPNLAYKMSRENLGWDFVGDTNRPFPPLYDKGHNYHFNEDAGHETHVAGIVAKNNDDVVIMALRTDNFEAADSQNEYDAITFASKHGVRIVNLSRGSCNHEHWILAEKAIKEHPEILFVIAAGNGDGYIENSGIQHGQRDNDVVNCQIASMPLPNVIHVAALDKDGKLADFSRYGKKSVEIGALGVDVVSDKAGGGQISLSGTSMAAPQVARVASLILKINPAFSPSEVLQILKLSLKKQTDLESKLAWGGGLDEDAALNLARKFKNKITP